MAASYRRRLTALPPRPPVCTDAAHERCALMAVTLGYLVFAALGRTENRTDCVRSGVPAYHARAQVTGR
ncbi:MAG: hypothetical protein JO015_02310 [Verrucomicrobia bacterium]|nr:hypothetical protein [Verrucomicrobiota bacterium]